MGLYTKEEMQDNDCKEQPMEELQEQVQRDSSESANSEPFVVAESEATDGAAVEPEKVVENEENVPEFMKDQGVCYESYITGRHNGCAI